MEVLSENGEVIDNGDGAEDSGDEDGAFDYSSF